MIRDDLIVDTPAESTKEGNQNAGEETPDFHPRNLSVIPLDIAEIIEGEKQAESEETLDFHPRNLSVVPLDLDAILADELA